MMGLLTALSALGLFGKLAAVFGGGSLLSVLPALLKSGRLRRLLLAGAAALALVAGTLAAVAWHAHAKAAFGAARYAAGVEDEKNRWLIEAAKIATENMRRLKAQEDEIRRLELARLDAVQQARDARASFDQDLRRIEDEQSASGSVNMFDPRVVRALNGHH